MKSIRLQESPSEAPGGAGRGAHSRQRLPGEKPARPVRLIDTQTLRTLKVQVGSQPVATDKPRRRRAAAKGSELTLAMPEKSEGYDPYNNVGRIATRRG